MHGPCVLGLSLTISRMAANHYVYMWGVVTPFITINPVSPPATMGDCRDAFAWQQRSLIQGVIVGSRRCAPGDYVRFEAKSKDTDALVLRCLPGAVCTKPQGLSIPMSDTLNYDWMSTKGKFVKTPTKNARQIAWKAPSTSGPVDISVRITDSGKEFVDPQLIISTRIDVTQPRPAPVLSGKGGHKKKKTRKK